MRNSDRHKRLKRLEQQEIHTLKRGRKQLLSKAEFEQCADDRPVFIDDI